MMDTKTTAAGSDFVAAYDGANGKIETQNITLAVIAYGLTALLPPDASAGSDLTSGGVLVVEVNDVSEADFARLVNDAESMAEACDAAGVGLVSRWAS